MPTDFNFGISDNPSNIPVSFGFDAPIVFRLVSAFPYPLFGGGIGRDETFEVLLPATRPDIIGPLLSTVVVFFSFFPF